MKYETADLVSDNVKIDNVIVIVKKERMIRSLVMCRKYSYFDHNIVIVINSDSRGRKEEKEEMHNISLVYE